MGLDVTVRTRKKDGSLTEFADFNGRNEFAVIREWIGDDRYGQWIDLNDARTLRQLQSVIETELLIRVQEDPENFDDMASIEIDGFSNSLVKLYSLISLAPVYAKCGWIMEIEADW